MSQGLWGYGTGKDYDMWQGLSTHDRVWGHVAGGWVHVAGCGLMWQGVGACDKGYGHLAGGGVGTCGRGGGMWQGVGSCGRGWGHVAGCGYVKICQMSKNQRS